jgi:choline kinase
VGIHKVGRDLHREILGAASVLAGTDDYENAINLARKNTPVHCELVPDLVWAEIDNEAMYARVNRLIEPRLREIAEKTR